MCIRDRPWRQRSTDLVLEDIRQIERDFGFMYLSVDVMSPAGVRKLAQSMVDADLYVNWSAELRLERSFSAETCKLLRQSGCVSVAVGYESGTQRILDMMDKGTKITDIRNTLANYKEAGIGVQMMSFIGFPTETSTEALATLEFMVDNRDKWDSPGVGAFTLTAQSFVAKNPKDYAVTVEPRAGQEVPWAPVFHETEDTGTAEDWKAVWDYADLHFNRVQRQFPELGIGNPFLMGTDTAHSIFYRSRFGPNLYLHMEAVCVERLDTQTELLQEGKLLFLGEVVRESQFDLFAFEEKRRAWKAVRDQAKRDNTPFNYQEVTRLEGLPDWCVDRDEGTCDYLLLGYAKRISRATPAVLKLVAMLDGTLNMQEVLAFWPEGSRDQVRGLIEELHTKGYVRGAGIESEAYYPTHEEIFGDGSTESSPAPITEAGGSPSHP